VSIANSGFLEVILIYKLLREMHDLGQYERMSTQHAVDEPTEEAWIPTTDSLGARLALIRQRMGWNIKEAALACDIPPASWTDWELNGRKPRDLEEAATKIARRTGADDYWIMTGRYPQNKISGGPLEGATARQKKSFLSESNRRPFHYKGDESNVLPFPSRPITESLPDIDARIYQFRAATA
jgi:transcriptional regulator with XRE-family HTH domain